MSASPHSCNNKAQKELHCGRQVWVIEQVIEHNSMFLKRLVSSVGVIKPSNQQSNDSMYLLITASRGQIGQMTSRQLPELQGNSVPHSASKLRTENRVANKLFSLLPDAASTTTQGASVRGMMCLGAAPLCRKPTIAHCKADPAGTAAAAAAAAAAAFRHVWAPPDVNGAWPS